MSTRSQRNRQVSNSRPSTGRLTQNSRRSQTPNATRLSQRSQPSQQTIESQLGDVSVSVVNCVRYFLTNMHSNTPIRKATLVKHVFDQRPPKKTLDAILKKTSEELNEIYGLKLRVIDEDTANIKYIIVNNLEHLELNEDTAEDNLICTITFLTLTHIFMSKDKATDDSLWIFLREFGISPADEIEGIGTVQTLVTKHLVKQQYIKCEDHGGKMDDGVEKLKLFWGVHAENSVSKMKILKFCAKMYDTKNLKRWTEQFNAAEEQILDAEEDEEEAVEVLESD